MLIEENYLKKELKWTNQSLKIPPALVSLAKDTWDNKLQPSTSLF